MTNVIDFKKEQSKKQILSKRDFQSIMFDLTKNLNDLSKNLTTLKRIALDIKFDIEKQQRTE